MIIQVFKTWSIPLTLGEYETPLKAIAGATPVMGASGYWDNQGSATVVRPGVVKVKFAFTGDDWATIDAAVDAAKKELFSGRNVLYMAVGDSFTTADRQAQARCLKFDVQYRYDHPHFAEASAEFELLQPHWDDVSLTSTNRTAASFSIVPGGSAPINRTMQIKINGPLSASWTLTNTSNGMSLTYNAAADPISSGSYVTIDCGKMTVTHSSGADKWSRLTIGSNQVAFMEMLPGLNSFTQSPAASITISYRVAYW